jgi:probable HAF family extracellular repeat protein
MIIDCKLDQKSAIALLRSAATIGGNELGRISKSLAEFKHLVLMITVRNLQLCSISFALGSVVLFGGAAHAASSSSAYNVIEIGSVDQTLGEVVRGPDNADGVIGGTAGFGFGTRAFQLTRSELRKIETLPGADRAIAHGTNAQGVVIGSTNTATSIRAFLWTAKDGARDLGALPGDGGSEAFGINNYNEVVGYSSGPHGIEAVLWTADAKIHGLGALSPGDYSRARAINDIGEVVGSSGQAGNNRAFLWTRGGGMVDLGTLPGDTDSVALGINRQTQVIGYSSGTNGTRAIIWTRGGGMKSLGTLLGHDFSRALSINDRGEVVGVSAGPSGARAFLWTDSSGMRDLNSLIKLDGDFILAQGVGINDRGTILTVARDDDGGGDAHDHHELPGRIMLLMPQR